MIIERVYVSSPADDPVSNEWPFTLARVQQIVSDGLSFDRSVTMLVGENGSGKSTIVEAIAEAYGVDVRGGHAGRLYASSVPKGPLGQRLRLVATKQGARMKGRRAKDLSGSANTVGWYRGNPTIKGYLYDALGLEWLRRENTCANSTYCTLPTWFYCPTTPGWWRWHVAGSGPGGSTSDDAYAWVS